MNNDHSVRCVCTSVVTYHKGILCVFSPDWPPTVRPGRIACYTLFPSHNDFFFFSPFPRQVITVFLLLFSSQDSHVSAVSAARNSFRRSCCSLKYNMMKFGSKNSANTPIKCTIRLLDDNQLLDSEFQVWSWVVNSREYKYHYLLIKHKI